ncbi:hypothetical protein Tco_1393931 [Tanacetum coccineum]
MNQNNIEDLYVLKIQDNMHNIDGVGEYDLINALLLYIRRIMIKKRVKDTHLGVESYQTKPNLTKPQFSMKDLHFKQPYTTFSDGMPNKVYQKLDVMLKDNVLGFGNEGFDDIK